MILTDIDNIYKTLNNNKLFKRVRNSYYYEYIRFFDIDKEEALWTNNLDDNLLYIRHQIYHGGNIEGIYIEYCDIKLC